MRSLRLGQLEEDVLERGALGLELADGDAGLTSARLIAGARRGSAVTAAAVDARHRLDAGQSASRRARLVERLGPHAQARAAAQLVDRALGDQRAVADHADAVADLLDLAHQVAGEQDRALALRRARG